MYKKHAIRSFAWLLLACLATAADADAAKEPVAGLAQTLRSAGACPAPLLEFDPAARARLDDFYRRHDYRHLWTAPRQVDQLVRQLEALEDDGIDPAVYQPREIRRQLQGRGQAARARDCADLLASHAYLLALHHLLRGRLDQSLHEPLWRSADAAAQQALRLRLESIADAGLAHPEQAFAQARPGMEPYHNLRSAYARLRRATQASDPWPSIAAGPTLRPGQQDARVPLIRARLLRTGHLAPGQAGTGDTYQPALVAAVQAFQVQHSLEPDGLVGRQTLAALNTHPRQRVDQLRVNLERFRWLAREVEPDSLLVDIAAGRVILFRGGKPRWEARTQVGRATRRTPGIKSSVTRLTLNPTWTIPPTILREDKLPLIREDIGYLARHHLQVLDAQGNLLDPYQVDWNDPRGILLRQAAGPDNPLGRVAIRFANPYSIYLHDTPSQALFAQSPRAFSSGCVRVESVMQLVELLLDDRERQQVATLLESGQTHEFRLARPLPILLAYWTAHADERGQPRYRPDIYRQDAPLLAALLAAPR